MTPDQLRHVFTLAHRISQSPVLIQQLISEIESGWSAELLDTLRMYLDGVDLCDVGVTETTWPSYFPANTVTHVPIYESEEMSICLFALSTGAVLPLHDHPEMAAITRVMHGYLRFKLADMVSQDAPNLFTYRYRRTGELRAPGLLSLTPKLCNLHQFLAMENTLLLDIFIPNYSLVRDVTYFLELSDTKLCGIKSPCFNLRQVQYKGVMLGDVE